MLMLNAGLPSAFNGGSQSGSNAAGGGLGRRKQHDLRVLGIFAMPGPLVAVDGYDLRSLRSA